MAVDPGVLLLPGVVESDGGGGKKKTDTTTPQPSIGEYPDITFDFPGVPGGDSGAAKAAALRGVDIERARLAYQQKSGLRDIEQAREQGLKAAINNALQRGIYRSGIRAENEVEVGREADEATADLNADIGFALDLLKSRADQIRAGGGGGGAAGFGFGLEEIMRLIGFGAEYGFNMPPVPSATPSPLVPRPRGYPYGGPQE